MKKLWEEISTLHAKTQCSCNCICGAKDNLHKAEHDRRLIQFLMGLNEVYTVICGSILMMNPLPSLAQTFSLLVQDEKQRKIQPNNQLLRESASMNVNVPTVMNANMQRQTNYRTNYYHGSTSQSNSKSRVMHEHCKQPGHTKDK
ncbi:hypothetical protein K7X08_011388 [Anisodus acutangulus]|uniref:Uncharacterized protein n=1 Tax=Anisodus acutangulus TaxID=402998 RepID=A0A9Q1RKU9_9SOLA|nr:hypothetical protein K7X08_011388 [Anisodus acutangulus]